MNIVNFSHPLTGQQLAQIASQVGQVPDTVIDVGIQFDVAQAFVPQVVALLDTIDVDTVRWQSETWLVVLPSLNFITAILLAELHGRMGHFPAIVRLRPTTGSVITEYVIEEIIDLEQVRQAARHRR